MTRSPLRATGCTNLRNRRYAQDWSTQLRGGLPLVLHESVTDTSAYTTDRRGGVVLTVAPVGLQATQRRVEDNAPYAPLAPLDRARRNAATIRIVRDDRSDSVAILFDDRSIVTTLRFDRRSHLLIDADALFDNWAVGLAPFEIRFGRYLRLGRIQLARHVTTWFQHQLLTDLTFPDVAIGSAAPPGAFDPPSNAAGAVSIGGPLRITIDSVAQHVWVIRYGQTAAPNFGYNAPFAYAQLVVELGNRLLLIDAPWSSSAEQSAITVSMADFGTSRSA